MSLVKLLSCSRKSRFASQPRSPPPCIQSGPSRILASATAQPSSPPASANRARIFAARAFVSFSATGRPRALAISFHMAKAFGTSSESVGGLQGGDSEGVSMGVGVGVKALPVGITGPLFSLLFFRFCQPFDARLL